MGNWNINIQGVGAHHNTDNAVDANQMAKAFVEDLQRNGHFIESAVFTYGGKENLLTVFDYVRIENEAALLYHHYCDAVGGKAFNGDPLPSWDEFVMDEKKTKQANAWRRVALISLQR